jgi:hypothetical protein
MRGTLPCLRGMHMDKFTFTFTFLCENTPLGDTAQGEGPLRAL